jgi:hypothetical protein
MYVTYIDMIVDIYFFQCTFLVRPMPPRYSTRCSKNTEHKLPMAPLLSGRLSGNALKQIVSTQTESFRLCHHLDL